MTSSRLPLGAKTSCGASSLIRYVTSQSIYHTRIENTYDRSHYHLSIFIGHLAVAFRLQAEQLRIKAGVYEQLGVGAGFDDPACLQHDDPIRDANGREAMRNDDGHAAGRQFS